jgi:hypothetical protein
MTPATDAVREAVKAAYLAGAMAVHEHWQENPGDAPRGDPEFSEAASDYAVSIALTEAASQPREGEVGDYRLGLERAAHECEWMARGYAAYLMQPLLDAAKRIRETPENPDDEPHCKRRDGQRPSLTQRPPEQAVPWSSLLGGLIEAQRIARQAYKSVEGEKAINGHIPGNPYDVTMSALNSTLAALDTLIAGRPPEQAGAVPVGKVERMVEASYWMGHADGSKLHNQGFDPAIFGAQVLAAMGGQTCRDVAPVIGISKATLNRVTRGMMPDLPTYFALCRWLSPATVPTSAAPTPPDAGSGSDGAGERV